MLSIVIVNFNAREHLVNCLQSLVRDRPAVDHEVIVVDNGSTDRTPDTIAVRFPWVKLIRLSANVGFAAGNNAGIRESQGDLLLLLNSDTVVPAGAIDSLVQALLAHPDAAVAFHSGR
jgi:GT2 family glycosyltransferase